MGNHADLTIPTACGADQMLHLTGTAFMESDVPTGHSDGVTFSLQQDGKSLVSLSLSGEPGSTEAFDVVLQPGQLVVHINDNGNSAWDWFAVDASFSCTGTDITWSHVMRSSAARSGQFMYNNGQTSTISNPQGNKVRMDPGWSPRPAGGDNFADLAIPTVCGTDQVLHLTGTASMEAE